MADQIGLESDPMEYIAKLVRVFDEVKRALKPTGSVYVNLGDTYCSLGKWGGPTKQSLTGIRDRGYPEGMRPNQMSHPTLDWVRGKQLALIPARFAIAMQDKGWILRNDIIWHKINGLPSSVKDRLSNRYEHLFHFVKNERYYYNLEAIREPYKLSSFKRFGGLVSQGFIKHASKYNRPHIPRGVQFADGKTPVPTWLQDYANARGNREAPAVKLQLLYQMTKGRIGHGHYGGGRYVGITTSTPGKNPGDVWSLSSSSFRGAHFAVYPEKLCVKPILSSCPPMVCTACGVPKREIVDGHTSVGSAFNIRVRDAQKGVLAAKWGNRIQASADETDNYDEASYASHGRQRVLAAGCNCGAGFTPGVVLDPFAGSGTTLKAARDFGRSVVGIEINPEYAEVVKQRLGSFATELEVVNQGLPA